MRYEIQEGKKILVFDCGICSDTGLVSLIEQKSGYSRSFACRCFKGDGVAGVGKWHGFRTQKYGGDTYELFMADSYATLLPYRVVQGQVQEYLDGY